MLQRLHHVCLKVKHACLSRHPRTVIRDSPVNRSVMQILYKQGFISQAVPGDTRGPFYPGDTSLDTSEQSLSKTQKERLEIYKRLAQCLTVCHEQLGTNPQQDSMLLSPEQKMKLLEMSSSSESSSSLPLNSRLWMEFVQGLTWLPALKDVPLPVTQKDADAESLNLNNLTTDQKLVLTWPKDRRLWIDLRYDPANQPALVDMFLVSKGSRKVFTTPEQLENIHSGRMGNPWGGGDIGAVTLLNTTEGIITDREALKRGLGGQVLCVAK